MPRLRLVIAYRAELSFGRPRRAAIVGGRALRPHRMVIDSGLGPEASRARRPRLPEHEAHLWNPKGYFNTAWCRVHVTAAG